MKSIIIATLLAFVSIATGFPLVGITSHALAVHESTIDKSVTIPANTVFRVKLNQSLSSKTAKVGDIFTAKVTSPVTVKGLEAVPEGSIVYGRVSSVTKAARRSNGTIGVTFYKLEIPSKRTHQISGSLASLDEAKGTSGEMGAEGEVKGKSTKKRNIVFIGGGAGTGAVIGAIAGGGKGAAIGAAVGAGAGAAAALLTNGHEAEVNSGTEIGVALNRSVTVTVRI